MKGSIDKQGNCKLEWNFMERKVYSPDGRQQLLPCEDCGDPTWCNLMACSVICELCAVAYQPGYCDDPELSEDEIARKQYLKAENGQ